MWYERPTGRAPPPRRQRTVGFGGVVEGLVLWARDDIAIANIGHDGAKFAPYIMTLFFFILYSNLLGLFPHGSTPTGNIAVTGRSRSRPSSRSRSADSGSSVPRVSAHDFSQAARTERPGAAVMSIAMGADRGSWGSS